MRASYDDLADAALAKHDGGAPRLLRRRLLKALVARTLGAHADLVRLERRPGGSIGLASPTSAFVSAAGRGLDLMIAIGRDPIGVDLEPSLAAFPLPLDVLTAQEAAALAAMPAAQRGRAFLTFWVIKEAYAKALERGLALTPEQIAVASVKDEWLVRSEGEPCGHAEVFINDTATSAAVTVDRCVVASRSDGCRVAPFRTGRTICDQA